MDVWHHAPAPTVAAASDLARRLSGAAIGEVTSARGVRHLVRLLTWIDGVPLGSVPFMREDADHLAATLDEVLAG